MTSPCCFIGCTRGTGLQITRQLPATVVGIARDPVNVHDLLQAAAESRPGDVADCGSLRAARLGPSIADGVDGRRPDLAVLNMFAQPRRLPALHLAT
jgi:hypothetical protein